MNTEFNIEPFYNKFKTEISRQHKIIVEYVCQTTGYNNTIDKIPYDIMRHAICNAIIELMKKETLIYVYTIDETYKLAENLYNNDRLNNVEYYYTRREKIKI
jgi:hypothetical protein